MFTPIIDILAILAIVITFTITDPAHAGALVVTFIDVGQGDAALLQCDGHAMLIDAGPNAAAKTVVAFLTEKRVTAFDYVVGTHPHEDHIGGLDAVINYAGSIGEVWMPYTQTSTRTFEDVLDAVESHKLTVTQPTVGKTYPLGDSTITILGPIGKNYAELNNFSIVLRVDHDGNSFIFTGDAERLSEDEMLRAGSALNGDVLKVGHHGSSTATSDAFLAKVDPTYAVISCGKGNKYGHPDAETVNKLEAARITILRTDMDGSIVITSDKGQLNVAQDTKR
ncbi:MAG: MBL fold metallo-hydrolase [Oscillospiraceae bacterium]|nr:MBL fold metallo-hydrolase [Oscillospiraceae bacterium]